MRPVMAALSFNWIVSAKAKERPDQATHMTNANRFDMGRSYLRRAIVTSRLWPGARLTYLSLMLCHCFRAIFQSFGVLILNNSCVWQRGRVTV